MNWYKKAKLIDQLEKDAGAKENFIVGILSLISSIGAYYESGALNKILDQKNVPIEQKQQLVDVVNNVTEQNKNINDINYFDLEEAKKALQEIKSNIDAQKIDNSQKIDKKYDLQGNGELNIDKLKDTIRRHEGKSNKVYLDPSKKNWCVGHGFNLNKPEAPSIIKSLGADYRAILSGKQSLTDTQVEKLLDINVKEAIDIAKGFAPNYNKLPSDAKLVLVNMAFMGKGTLNKFDDLKNALIRKDYSSAANEMMDSLWAKQVGRRATELARIMKSLANI